MLSADPNPVKVAGVVPGTAEYTGLSAFLGPREIPIFDALMEDGLYAGFAPGAGQIFVSRSPDLQGERRVRAVWHELLHALTDSVPLTAFSHDDVRRLAAMLTMFSLEPRNAPIMALLTGVIDANR